MPSAKVWESTMKRTRLLNGGLVLAAALPLAIALVICTRALYVIWPELTSTQATAMAAGLALISFPGIVAAAFGTRLYLREEQLNAKSIFGLIALMLVCFYCFWHFVEPHVFFRDWLFDHDTYLAVILSALIPLFYYLLYYLAAVLAITTPRGLVISILVTVLIPVFMYLGFNLARFVPGLGNGAHLWQMVVIILTTAFSFFILRLMTYMLAKSAESLQKPATQRALQIIFIGILPFLGLALNTRGPVSRESQNVLGNFSAVEFWVLAAVNALVYLLPRVRYAPLEFAHVALRAAGFTFVLYFCTVFILFLPLAVILIAAIGLGFLLLIPYFAAAVQIFRLRQDYILWNGEGKRRQVIVALVVGGLLLPLGTLAHIYTDRFQLAATLRHLEQPPLKLNAESPVNAAAVLRLAEEAPRANNRGRSWKHGERNIPIYDALHRQIVFDGADLSEALRKKIRVMFGGFNDYATTFVSNQPRATLADVAVSKKAAGGLTQSTLRITVSNSESARDAEFNERIELPPGAFVTAHWLTIEGVEVPAQITNKNTAIWVYNRVTEARRDPSLIYYEGANSLRWRIFPVPVRGIRQARIVITHAYDTTLRIGDRKLTLTAETAAQTLKSTSGRVALIAPAEKEETTHRTPYLHFVADCGATSAHDFKTDAEAAAKLLDIPLTAARISFVNASIYTTDLATASKCATTSGGFFAEMAVKAVLYNQFAEPREGYPLIVMLAEKQPQLNGGDLSHMTLFYGDADGVAHFDGKKLASFRFATGKYSAGKPLMNLPVRLFNGHYVAAAQSLIVGNNANKDGSPHTMLDGVEKFYDFYLGKSNHRGAAVMAAVETGVLNPAAGSIVLETEAQRRRLAELHQKMLDARNQLDTGEVPRMSEPWGFVLIGLAVVVFIGWRRQRARARIAWFDEEP